MSFDLNLCQFIGRLGADPEVRYMQDGKAAANIRIAVGWKTKDKEGTEWVPVTAFGRLAEIMGEHLQKGSRIYVSGRFRTRKWQAQDGSDRYSTEVVANQMQMLDGRPQGGQAPAPQQAQQATQEFQQPQASRSPSSDAPQPGAYDDFDDDIPF